MYLISILSILFGLFGIILIYTNNTNNTNNNIKKYYKYKIRYISFDKNIIAHIITILDMNKKEGFTSKIISGKLKEHFKIEIKTQELNKGALKWMKNNHMIMYNKETYCYYIE
jgi:hypothetical protein